MIHFVQPSDLASLGIVISCHKRREMICFISPRCRSDKVGNAGQSLLPAASSSASSSPTTPATTSALMVALLKSTATLLLSARASKATHAPLHHHHLGKLLEADLRRIHTLTRHHIDHILWTHVRHAARPHRRTLPTAPSSPSALHAAHRHARHTRHGAPAANHLLHLLHVVLLLLQRIRHGQLALAVQLPGKLVETVVEVVALVLAWVTPYFLLFGEVGVDVNGEELF